MKLLLSKLILLLLPVITFAQADTAKISIFPRWQVNEVHHCSIAYHTTDVEAGVAKKYLSNFNVAITVLEKYPTGYLLDWRFTEINLAPGEPVFENLLTAPLKGQPLLIRVNEFGRFIEIKNSAEIRGIAVKKAAELAEKSRSSETRAVFQRLKIGLETPLGVETIIAKPVKFFLLINGFDYTPGKVVQNDIKMPNPVSPVLIEAVEKVWLSSVKDSLCTVESTKKVDGKILTAIIRDFLIKSNPAKGEAIMKQLGGKQMEFSESTKHLFNLNNGSLLQGTIIRTSNLGINNRKIVMQLKVTD
ncbi:hypothetical protein [Pedobacter frigidisoli]|uniref:hypothetical protein n=1 Tax=Pedobacter frigidisoli TaxID=2530455 RepID=UPI00292EC970|nr:hypothetical protein [Pedobacter frigidisoli]